MQRNAQGSFSGYGSTCQMDQTAQLGRRKGFIQDVQARIEVFGGLDFLRERARNEQYRYHKPLLEVLCNRHAIAILLWLEIEDGQRRFKLRTSILQIIQGEYLNHLMPLVFQDLPDFH